MSRRLPRPGLYAIADTATLAASGRDLTTIMDAAMAGGARLVQYRDKTTEHARRKREAAELVRLGRAHGVPVLINDDLALALAVAADGVHLGADDPDPAGARAQLGGDAIIGVSCYDQLARARAAAAAGADYIAFGRMFPSTTKPGGPQPQPGLLQTARRETGLAICGIGGITTANAAAVVAAGADYIAVIGDLLLAADVYRQAATFTALFGRADASTDCHDPGS